MKQQFVVTRYAPGACGRFLSTVLQTSTQIACWDETVQQSKFGRDTNLAEQFRSLAETKFSDDPSWHMRYEPDVPYNTHFYSGSYERGEHVSLQQYLEYQQDCPVFWQHWENVDHLNLLAHKSRLPEFMRKSKVVNVLLDTDKGMELAKFFNWIKRYQVDENGIKLLANDPERGNPRRAAIAQQFDNPLYTDVPVDEFQQSVNNEQVWKLFSSLDHVTADPINQDCEQYTWSLESILDRDNFVHSILQIFETMNVEPGDIDSVVALYDTYWKKQQRHIFEFGSNSLLA